MTGCVAQGRLCRLRAYEADDAERLAAIADDFMVARWMTRGFAHPYTLRHAQEWIALTARRPSHFAIEADGVLAGGAGFDPHTGERSGTASFGYWLSRDFWGRGIATEAARMLSDHALQRAGLRRLEARVFAQNIASARVLEKCGFVLEGRAPGCYVDRNDEVCDGLVYARLR